MNIFTCQNQGHAHRTVSEVNNPINSVRFQNQGHVLRTVIEVSNLIEVLCIEQ